MRQPQGPTAHGKGRGGFTLPEILVVLAIIAVLVSLTAAAVFQWFGGAAIRNTETVLRKVDNALQARWSEAWKQAEEKTRGQTPPQPLIQLAGNDIERARVMWRKLLMSREFPMTYQEAVTPVIIMNVPVVPPSPGYVRALQGRSPGSVAAQSSELLLLALSRNRSGASFAAEEGLGAGALKDTDNNGLPEIVDNWERPIAFYRWGVFNPALLAEGMSRSPNPLGRDTEDPDHKLMDGNWNNAANQNNVMLFEQLCHPVRNQGGQPASYFTSPMAVSYGDDGLPGIGFPLMNPLGNGQDKDNIYSFTLR